MYTSDKGSPLNNKQISKYRKYKVNKRRAQVT